jgi:hypothetical protein
MMEFEHRRVDRTRRPPSVAAAFVARLRATRALKIWPSGHEGMAALEWQP